LTESLKILGLKICAGTKVEPCLEKAAILSYK